MNSREHADLLRTLPYALLLLWPSLRAIPPEYLDAAALDGYGEWGRIRRVALPLTRDATIAAWGVTALVVGGYAVAIIARGRALSRRVPPEDRRWM